MEKPRFSRSILKGFLLVLMLLAVANEMSCVSQKSSIENNNSNIMTKNAAATPLSQSSTRLTEKLPGVPTDYHGFAMHAVPVAGLDCIVIAPHTPADGKPWIWRAEFFDHRPELDLMLLAKGFHMVYLPLDNSFGCPDALDKVDLMYDLLVLKFGLSRKPVLEGYSRGGLYVYNWAARHPDRASAIYADNAVCDFKSWPGGKGRGPGSKCDWAKLLRDYHFKNEAEALAYKLNPIDNLAPLAKAGIPLIHLTNLADESVPPEENTAIVKERYEAMGGTIKVITRPGLLHHPHGLDDPAPIAEFILQHLKS